VSNSENTSFCNLTFQFHLFSICSPFFFRRAHTQLCNIPSEPSWTQISSSASQRHHPHFEDANSLQNPVPSASQLAHPPHSLIRLNSHTCLLNNSKQTISNCPHQPRKTTHQMYANISMSLRLQGDVLTCRSQFD
jgi:hypothetical protein